MATALSSRGVRKDRGREEMGRKEGGGARRSKEEERNDPGPGER